MWSIYTCMRARKLRWLILHLECPCRYHLLLFIHIPFLYSYCTIPFSTLPLYQLEQQLLSSYNTIMNTLFFIAGYSIVNIGQLTSNQYKAIPLHLIDWDIHVKPCGLKVQFSAGGLPWKSSSKFPSSHVISCIRLGSSGESDKLFKFCAHIRREASERNTQDSSQFSSYIITLASPFCVVNLLPCDMCLSLCGSHKSDNKQGDVVKKGRDISYHEVRQDNCIYTPYLEKTPYLE